MLSLISKNRNKKKRIRKSFVGALPQKIIFDTPNATPDAAHDPKFDSSASDSDSSESSPSSSDFEKEPNLAPLPASHQPEPESQPPRLIAPSERQESGTLPPGLFVTSIDVEEGIRQPKRKNKKGKRKMQHSQRNANDHPMFQNSYKEPAGDPETFYASPPVVGQAEGLYQIYEHTWEDFPKLESFKMENVKVGSVVGWHVSITFFLPSWQGSNRAPTRVS